MSFTSTYQSVNIAANHDNVRTALQNVLNRHGWEMVNNEERAKNGLDPVMVRAHGNENTTVYPMVLVNPSTEHNAYDIGVEVTNEGQNAELVYDSYQGSVENEFGKGAVALKKEVIIESVRTAHNSIIQGYGFDEFMRKYVTDTDGNPMTVEDLKGQSDLLLSTLEDPTALML